MKDSEMATCSLHTNVIVFVLNEEGHMGGWLDVGPLALRPVPDVQNCVPLLGDEPLGLVAVDEAHLGPNGGGTVPSPPWVQVTLPKGTLPDPDSYPGTSGTDVYS